MSRQPRRGGDWLTSPVSAHPIARELMDAWPRPSEHFDLETLRDRQALSLAPERVLSGCRGLVVLDEVQRLPQVFGGLDGLVRADLRGTRHPRDSPGRIDRSHRPLLEDDGPSARAALERGGGRALARRPGAHGKPVPGPATGPERGSRRRRCETGPRSAVRQEQVRADARTALPRSSPRRGGAGGRSNGTSSGPMSLASTRQPGILTGL